MQYARPTAVDNSTFKKLKVFDPAADGILLSGVRYHSDAMRGRKWRPRLWLELVPESGNPCDSQAVAVDRNGRRVGYLPRGVFGEWQKYVTAMNRQHVRVFLPTEKYNEYEIELLIPSDEKFGKLWEAAGLSAGDLPVGVRHA